MNRIFGSLAASMVLIFVVSSKFAFGATIYIPDDHPTIQSGIEAASVGDTVIVRNGV